MKRLGDILSSRSSRHRAGIERALLLQQSSRGRLGDILSRYGLISGREIATAIAEQTGLPVVWLDAEPPDAALFTSRDLIHYRARNILPWRRIDGVLTLATSDPSAALNEWLTAHYGEPVALVVTSPRDIRRTIRQLGRSAINRQAIFSLKRQTPNLSAARTVTRPQLVRLVVALALIGAGIALAPQGDVWFALIVATNLFYLTTLIFKLYLYFVWRSLPKPIADPTRIEECDLPLYAILVPLYHESAPTIRQILRAIATLEYPPYLLEVKIICEEDDADTIQAVKDAAPPEYCDLVLVPASAPRTKPKACNVALADVTAEFVVIFDAEDIPAADQLKKAVSRFRELPLDVACLQAPLNYYNRDENLLTRLFSIEYGSLFGQMLPALQALAIPMPLGGTSNHLRTAALRKVGGWDAFNVTEDADLGIRLSYFGYRTEMLDSLTLEEAPITFRAWFKQRARWIKGYLQTWLVYTRDTRDLKKRLGRVGYYGFHFFIGAPALTFLLAPFFWVIFFISLLGLFPTMLLPWVLTLCILSLCGGIVSHWLFARTTIRAQGWMGSKIRQAGWYYPFYWLLHSIAAVKALSDLALRPHHWEKTRHGVSKLVEV
ncbi:MAG: glycosyltransferase family 2 protein [Alphaproteobacteria bacterium]